MRIIELFEQTIGSIGSTTGPVSTISPVSNKPSDQPAQTTNPSQSSKPNPNAKQLDQLLKQNQINVKNTDDFLRAFDALQQKQPIDSLSPEQQKALGDYTKATINRPGLSTQMSTLMKSITVDKKQ